VLGLVSDSNQILSLCHFQPNQRCQRKSARLQTAHPANAGYANPTAQHSGSEGGGALILFEHSPYPTPSASGDRVSWPGSSADDNRSPRDHNIFRSHLSLILPLQCETKDHLLYSKRYGVIRTGSEGPTCNEPHSAHGVWP